jgi:hypothetical protein
MEIKKKYLIKENYGSDDINDIFKQNPQLELIGTPKEYSKYLNTLFSSSKYKDIYYHQSKEMFDVYDFAKRKAYSSDLGKYLYLSKDKEEWKDYASGHRGPNWKSPVNTLYFKVNLINPHITRDFFGEKIEYNNNYDGEEGQMDGEEFQNYVRSTNDGIVEGNGSNVFQMVVFDSKNYLRLGSKQDTINFQKFLGENKYSENEIENLIKQYNPTLNTGKVFMGNFEGDVLLQGMNTKKQLDNNLNLKSKVFSILGLTDNDDDKTKRKGIEIYAKYLLAYPKGDLNGFKNFIKSNHEYLDTPSIVDAEWNTQFEGMEISKEELGKLLKTAHDDIARKTGTGSQISPTSDVIQNWIDNNPQKVKQITKEDAEDVNFMQEVTKGELEEAKKARTKLRKKKKADRCLRIARSKMPQTSAYRSGLIVQCRQGDIWKDLKEEEDETLDEKWSEKYKRSIDCNNPKGFSQKAHCKGRLKEEETPKGKIRFENEHLAHYSGQDNYELGVYEDDEIIGYVQYVIFENEITVSDILVRPNRRRESFGSMLIQKMKQLHPYAKYKPSLKTDLGSKFIHKDVDVNENFGSDDINLSGHKNYTDWVIVHRNLNKPPYWSIKKSNGSKKIGKVIGYDTSILLKDVRFIVLKGGQERARIEQTKNVHGGAVGKIVDSGGNYDTSGWTLVTYRPFIDDTFIDVETGEPIYNAKEAVLKNTKEIWVKKEDALNEKTDFSKEKEQGLHGWFARQGGKGKSKGWVDCNTCRDGKCKSCGRKEGESRSKYPACRPTPSACKTKGKGKSWGKKSTNEDVLNEQTKQDIEKELKLNEIKNLFKRLLK